MENKITVGFIGGGQMTNALLTAVLTRCSLPNNSRIIITDPLEDQLKKVIQNTSRLLKKSEKQYDMIVTSSNEDLVKKYQPNIVFLCIKPQVAANVLNPLQQLWNGKELIVSIMAGITFKYISAYLKPNQKIIRLIPNTPALVNSMAAGIAGNMNTNDNDLEYVINILIDAKSSDIGSNKIYKVSSENLLDAITGLSGSGPAYIFTLIEAMSDGGVKCGLSREIALKLAIQTVYGSAKMMLENSQTHPAQLKDQVTTPGGTTINGLYELEKNNFRYAIISAIEAACNRGHYLASKL